MISLEAAIEAFQAGDQGEKYWTEYGLSDDDVAVGLRAMFTELGIEFEDDYQSWEPSEGEGGSELSAAFQETMVSSVVRKAVVDKMLGSNVVLDAMREKPRADG